ncbi:penicillin-binding transpeptidase domain-containing protein [Bdellovibrio sp. HCB117]|uniref:penicillin-binding transpeptidase domain-containing protein n=1 Tax=Bdellovibrio sp. HCB117 TaxID=3394359 RepID=UPI0039B6A811
MKILSLILAAFVMTACSATSKNSSEKTNQENFFANQKGCFLLYNMKTGMYDKVIGDEECKTRYPACSTFKVPLAVMAFDAKVLKDENQVLKWDGRKDIRPEVNKDHNAKTWMSDSVVWFSQRITPKLGKKKFQTYLNDFDYGNKDISSGITTAWLNPPQKKGLQIMAYEQVDFMKKLWTNQLPASERSMELTREITYLETSPNGFKLNGKTGSNFYDKERKVNFGWFIAHVQKDDQEYIAVTNMSDLAPTEAGYGGPRAKQITKDILKSEGLW